MTDAEPVQKPKRPGRVRPRPAPRARAPRIGQDEVVDVPRHANGAVDQLAAMQQRLDALERQAGASFVEQQPERKPAGRSASPESLTPFQREMSAMTRPTPREIPRELPYNYPLRWYARPDGDIVQLQGDPQNRAMYADLGFHLLTPDEVERWETVERAEVVARQKRTAGLITAIRTYAARTPGYVLEYDLPHADEAFSDMSIERLLEVVAEIEAEKGTKLRIPKPKPEPKSRSRDTDVSSVDARIAGLLEGSTRGRSGGRTIEPTPGKPLNFIP